LSEWPTDGETAREEERKEGERKEERSEEIDAP